MGPRARIANRAEMNGAQMPNPKDTQTKQCSTIFISDCTSSWLSTLNIQDVFQGHLTSIQVFKNATCSQVGSMIPDVFSKNFANVQGFCFGIWTEHFTRDWIKIVAGVDCCIRISATSPSDDSICLTLRDERRIKE